MARFEAALALAGAAAGLVPPEHAHTISRVCRSAAFDSRDLARQARLAGTLAIPFVKALSEQVGAASPEAARYVHFGATSQDALDSAIALCLKSAGVRISQLAVQLGDAAARLAAAEAGTATLARTLLQPAIPVPFAWKAAMWLAPLARSLPHWRQALEDTSVLQLGGAGGTLAAFQGKGAEVAEAMARELGLRATVTWHSARDAFARFGSESAILVGLAAKIARDVTLLMQPELGEASEPAGKGRGGSSSMPHKRNPSASLLALEAAARAPGLAATLLGELVAEHERGIGQWQGQWFTLRELTAATASALAAMADVVEGLRIDRGAMHANLERSQGLVFSEALAWRLSRAEADRLCEQAVRENRHLKDVVGADGRLAPHEVEELFRPERAFGDAATMTERVLNEWASARESAP